MGLWFRLQTGVVNNSKVQSLPPALFKAWINLLCIAKENEGLLPKISDVAFQLRCPVKQAQRLLSELTKRHLFDLIDSCGTLQPHDWKDHQYQSDVSTGRVRAFRKRRGNVSVTPSETEQSRAEQTAPAKTAIPKVSQVPSVRGFRSLRDAYHLGSRPTTEHDWKRAAEAIINCGISDGEIETEFVPWVRDELVRSNMPRRFYAPETLFTLDVKPWKARGSPNGRDPCLSNLPSFKPIKKPADCE